MKTIRNVQVLGFLVMAASMGSIYADSDTDYTPYCEAAGGTVENMPAKINMEVGLTKSFCTFRNEQGIAIIGLETFATDSPNIAATYIKKLNEIADNSPLWSGISKNPALNLCKNLGGASIGFVAAGGGFSNDLGESEVCVFGDGSMVSGWTLYYMTAHKEGYDVIKGQVKAQPLSIPMPN